MKSIKINVEFRFKGEVTVQAANKLDAKKQITNDFGLVLGRDLHTTNSNIIDWEFNLHPTKKIN